MAGEHILIVDDERLIQSTLRGVLEDEGYRVTSASSAEEALGRLVDDAPDLVFLDIWMPGMDGLEALAEMKQRRPETAVVMISGHATIETAVKASTLASRKSIVACASGWSAARRSWARAHPSRSCASRSTSPPPRRGAC